MNKVVLIGDLISSRNINTRGTTQSLLNKILKKINDQNKNLLSPITVTLGDEFQAVYKNLNSVFSDIAQIQYELYPVKARFSLGIGEITTRMNKKQALGMDGPAFYNARKGIEEIKKTNTVITIITNPEFTNPLLISALHLASHVNSKWTKNKYLILDKLIQKYSVSQISKILKISEQAVYKNIENSSIKYIVEVMENVSTILNKEMKLK